MHHHIHPHNWWAVMIKNDLNFLRRQVHEIIGKGPFSVVRRCVHRHTSQEFAVKVSSSLSIIILTLSSTSTNLTCFNTIVEGGGRGKVHIVTGPLLGRPEEGGHHMPHAQTSSHCWASRNLLQVHHHYRTWAPLIKYGITLNPAMCSDLLLPVFSEGMLYMVFEFMSGADLCFEIVKRATAGFVYRFPQLHTGCWNKELQWIKPVF